MKKFYKQMTKILLVVAVVVGFANTSTVTVEASNILDNEIGVEALCDVNDDENVSPCATNFEWRYKIVNGKTYRRLYNTSTDTWVGKWELVP